jgi:hypothetical protein
MDPWSIVRYLLVTRGKRCPENEFQAREKQSRDTERERERLEEIKDQRES